LRSGRCRSTTETCLRHRSGEWASCAHARRQQAQSRVRDHLIDIPYLSACPDPVCQMRNGKLVFVRCPPDHLVGRADDQLHLVFRGACPDHDLPALLPSSAGRKHESVPAACGLRRSRVMQRALRLRSPIMLAGTSICPMLSDSIRTPGLVSLIVCTVVLFMSIHHHWPDFSSCHPLSESITPVALPGFDARWVPTELDFEDRKRCQLIRLVVVRSSPLTAVYPIAGQMMTPDRESCCGVMSRHDP